MSYETAAPILSQFIDEATFMADFPEPPDPPPAPSDPDNAKKLALYAAFRDEFNANGGVVALARLARQMGVPLRWCQLLMTETRAAMAEVYAEPPE